MERADPHVSTRSSRLVIVGMFLLAVAASVIAIGYLRGLSRRSAAFWGPTTSELILRAPQVEVLQLAPAKSTSSAPYEMRRRHNASQARGLSNVRRALMQDASYDWDSRSAVTPARWEYALHFVDGDDSVVLLFALDPPTAMQQGRDEHVSTVPIATGLQEFFAEQFREAGQ